MKQQPDKMTAYYYRAAHSNTDLNLDNQMYRLLHHAKENGVTAYTLYVDNGFSGLSLDHPALNELRQAMLQGRIEKVIVTDISRISRNVRDAVAFSTQAAKLGIEIETTDGRNLRAELDEYRVIVAALNDMCVATKGGDCK